ncbi:MAG: HAD family hydrolase [Betaproteobacteria bacterium]|nr:HAD family hydrolase [Betaproteobacteria bacterium]
MQIAIDFDGTCVTHEYPEMGKDIGAVPVLQWLVEQGHKLILFTMRSGVTLEDAIGWFKLNRIELYGIQKDPLQHSWTKSPKAYAHVYIDDAALGCPLMYNPEVSSRPYVHWPSIRDMLTKLFEGKQLFVIDN